MYKASSTQAQSGPTDAGAGAAGAAPGSSTGGEAKKEGEVIDAEYVDVDEKK